jgi:hypothetical protein
LPQPLQLSISCLHVPIFTNSLKKLSLQQIGHNV